MIIMPVCTLTGLTLLPEIRVHDDDKPNTANSEVELELTAGDEAGHFTMEDRKRGTITLANPLDYDTGPHKFFLTVVAKVRTCFVMIPDHISPFS